MISNLTQPLVSVVMSVYNGIYYINAAIESILRQQGVNFEFIIINDGSIDKIGKIIDRFAAQDSRIRIVEQSNMGLTKALIKGCALAKGKFIARQDADDISLPGRLAKQAQLLDKRQDVALVSCWTRFIGENDEELFTVERHEDPDEATRKIRSINLKQTMGIPGHGSAMFRTHDYHRAGGYREQFYCAQDLDLWKRLTDHGKLAFVPEVLYQARWNEGSISAEAHQVQKKLKKITTQMIQVRINGGDESALLNKAAKIRPKPKSAGNTRSNGKGYYFIGKMLQHRNDPRAAKYFRRALECNPLHLKARLALMRCCKGE